MSRLMIRLPRGDETTDYPLVECDKCHRRELGVSFLEEMGWRFGERDLCPQCSSPDSLPAGEEAGGG